MPARRPSRPSATLLAPLLAWAVAAGAAETGDHAAAYDRTVRPLLATYCGACHDAAKHKGDVDFSAIRDGRQAIAKLPLWRSVGAQLTAKDMPPPEEKQPTADEIRTLTGWIRSLKSL